MLFRDRIFLPGLLPALLTLAVSGHLALDAQEAGPRPPAPTLSSPVGDAISPDAAGFLRRWMVLEPIPVGPQLSDSAIRARVATEHFPSQLTILPRHGDTVTVGEQQLTWHAVDTSLYNVNLYHFAWALSRPTSNVLFWAVTVVNAPREMTNVRLAIGSNAASVWWLNGEEVVALYNDRQSVIDDGVSDRVTLRPGRNVIRAAIINAGGATDFCARLLDEHDQPITNLTVSVPTAGQ
jgi:hypothetical protein